MATFKSITTYRLVVLLLVFLLGNSYLLLPADPAACCSDLYQHVALLSGFLLLTTVAAATILLYVRTAVSSAETEAKAAAAATGWRALLFLAVLLSLGSTMLAAITFESGFQYRQGRASGLFGWPGCVPLVILAADHGIAAGMVDVGPIQAS